MGSPKGPMSLDVIDANLSSGVLLAWDGRVQNKARPKLTASRYISGTIS